MATPVYPSFIDFSLRLKTFDEVWNVPIDKVYMAEAGFFYTTVNDLVRCFYCGTGIWDWKRDDNPFVEHARYSPGCSFLRAIKGSTFIFRSSRL